LGIGLLLGPDPQPAKPKIGSLFDIAEAFLTRREKTIDEIIAELERRGFMDGEIRAYLAKMQCG
jgi:hypothetical protein